MSFGLSSQFEPRGDQQQAIDRLVLSLEAGNRHQTLLGVTGSGKAFTAAIIPYHLTQQVINSNPIKLREYLSMGKPIVSVSTPEIEKFREYVAIGRTREEYLAHLDRAVAQGLTAEQIERQTALAATMTWDANLKKVMSLVEEQLAARNRHP